MSISVALATYNGEKFILEQLNSLYNQLQLPDEVIISDDHSTDATRKLVEEYIASHNLTNWKFVNNEEGRGVTDNFINALKHTTGDIIFLCDQDDVWEPDKVKVIVDSFDNDTMCVVSCISYIDQDGKTIKEKTTYTCKQDHIVDLSELCSVCSYLGMSSAFRRQVFLSTEEMLMKSTSHDWAMMVKASEMGKIKYIGKAVQKYRQHSNNASVIRNGTRKEKRLGFINRQMRIINNTKAFVKEHDSKAILDTYENFIGAREEWVTNTRLLSIIRNIGKYRRLKYTTRNIVADMTAAL